EPCPGLGAGDFGALLSAAEKIPDAVWILGCGSLPQGAPGDFYARLAALGSPHRRVAIDASGPSLRAAAAAGVALIKPNRAELEELVGRALGTVGDVVAAARELIEGGCESVLVSL